MAMWLFDVIVCGLYGFGLVWVAVAYVWAQHGGEGLVHPLSTYVERSLTFGRAHALIGVPLGLPVALVLTFLVGDVSSGQARRRARVTAGLTHAVVALVVMSLLGGRITGLLFVVVGSLLVGLAAGWWHDRLVSRPRVEDFYVL